MAVLRPLEERDSKGSTIRTNATIVYRQDQTLRTIRGRHDWSVEDNPDYHPPITAQVQDGKIVFFDGVPDTAPSRTAAKEIPQEKVPAYILKNLKKNPIKFREFRPTVFEVKLAKIGDVETTELREMANDGNSVTISAVEPDLRPNVQRAEASA